MREAETKLGITVDELAHLLIAHSVDHGKDLMGSEARAMARRMLANNALLELADAVLRAAGEENVPAKGH